MNVASLELCKELYKLSGWEKDANIRTWTEHKGEWLQHHGEGIPAYDLGYLLRKLQGSWHGVTFERGQYLAGKTVQTPLNPGLRQDVIAAFADTPEDAASKLAIELFKQGILTKETKE